MKLSYKDGKTYVEVDGETLSFSVAFFKYPIVRYYAKQIDKYRKMAKKLSQIIIANDKPISEKDCAFIHSFLNEAEWDTHTEKFSTPVKPDFRFNEFEYSGKVLRTYRDENFEPAYSISPGGYGSSPGGAPGFVYKHNKNLVVFPYCVHKTPDSDGRGCIWEDCSGFGLDVRYKDSTICRNIFQLCNFDEKYLDEVPQSVVMRNWDKLLEGLDLVSLKAKVIVDEYTDHKKKQVELGS